MSEQPNFLEWCEHLTKIEGPPIRHFQRFDTLADLYNEGPTVSLERGIEEFYKYRLTIRTTAKSKTDAISILKNNLYREVVRDLHDLRDQLLGGAKADVILEGIESLLKELS